MNPITIDHTDLQILRLLQKDAKLTNKELAHALRKGSNTMFDRVNRLKSLGIITGTVTLIDRRKFGELLIAFTHVQINMHSTKSLTEFQQQVINFTEVLECYHMTGVYDFMLKVAVRDMVSYNSFLVDKLAGLEHVGSLQSYFVINEAKRELSYPLEDLVALNA